MDSINPTQLFFTNLILCIPYVLWLIFYIITIVIAYYGYREQKFLGWLLLLLNGILKLLQHIPGAYSLYAMGNVDAGEYGKVLMKVKAVNYIISPFTAILFIVGLYLLLKEYRTLIKPIREEVDANLF